MPKTSVHHAVCLSTILLSLSSLYKGFCAPENPRQSSEEDSLKGGGSCIKLIGFQVPHIREVSGSKASGLRKQDQVPDSTILKEAPSQWNMQGCGLSKDWMTSLIRDRQLLQNKGSAIPPEKVPEWYQ